MAQFLTRSDGGVDHFRIWSLILMALAPLLLSLPLPEQWGAFQTACTSAIGMIATGLAQFSSSPRDVREICEMRKTADAQAAAVGEA